MEECVINPDLEPMSGWRFVELLWPLNDMFRARLPAIRGLPYDASFEAEADAAILALQDRPGAAGWAELSPGAWRVLLERHQQAITLAVMVDAQDKPFLVIPRGLSEDDQRTGAALLVLLEM